MLNLVEPRVNSKINPESTLPMPTTTSTTMPSTSKNALKNITNNVDNVLIDRSNSGKIRHVNDDNIDDENEPKSKLLRIDKENQEEDIVN